MSLSIPHRPPSVSTVVFFGDKLEEIVRSRARALNIGDLRVVTGAIEVTSSGTAKFLRALFYIGTLGIGAIVVFAISCNDGFMIRFRDYADYVLLRFANDAEIAMPRMVEQPRRGPARPVLPLTFQGAEDVTRIIAPAAVPPLNWRDYLYDDGTIRWDHEQFGRGDPKHTIREIFPNESAREIVTHEVFYNFYLTPVRCDDFGCPSAVARRALAEDLLLSVLLREKEMPEQPLDLYIFSLPGYGPFLSADFRARVAAVGDVYAAQVKLPSDMTANGSTEENVREAILHMLDCGLGAVLDLYSAGGSARLSAFVKEILPAFQSGEVAFSPFGWAKSEQQRELVCRILERFIDEQQKVWEFLLKDDRCGRRFERMYLRGCYLNEGDIEPSTLVKFRERLLSCLCHWTIAITSTPSRPTGSVKCLLDELESDGFATVNDDVAHNRLIIDMLPKVA